MELSVFRCCLCLCLSVALAMLGLYGALSCPAEGQVTAKVICGGQGAETIYLDAAGNQVPAPAGKTCDDCMACHPVQLAHAFQAPSPISTPPLNSDGVLPLAVSLHALAPAFSWPAVRGPPTLV